LTKGSEALALGRFTPASEASPAYCESSDEEELEIGRTVLVAVYLFGCMSA